MEKTVFKNQTFQVLVIVGLLGLLSWNGLVLLTTQSLIALVPLFAQTVLLVLILAKNRYAKLGLQVWAVLVIVGASF
ncbi:MAG: hypothetical protein AB3N14_15435, partial [Flavobacteriaceae bacterium]